MPNVYSLSVAITHTVRVCIITANSYFWDTSYCGDMTQRQIVIIGTIFSTYYREHPSVFSAAENTIIESHSARRAREHDHGITFTSVRDSDREVPPNYLIFFSQIRHQRGIAAARAVLCRLRVFWGR